MRCPLRFRLSKILLLTIVLTTFQSCFEDKSKSLDLKISCGLPDSALSSNYVIKVFEENGTPLNGRQIYINENLNHTSKGCVIVPKDFKKEFAVRKGSEQGLLVVPSKLSEGINKIFLQKYMGDFNVWSYCGEVVDDPNKMFIKFTDRVPKDLTFIDKYYESKKVSTNSQGCAKVPFSPGKIIVDGKFFSFIPNPNPIVFSKEEGLDTGDFLSICKSKGTSDRIIEILSEKFNTKDCNKLFQLAYEIKHFNHEFIGKNIKSLAALNGLENIVTLNVKGNLIQSLYGLRNLQHLFSLSLQGNRLLFLDEIPKSVKILAIDRNPIASFRSAAHLDLKTLTADEMPFESLDGMETQQNLGVIYVNHLYALEKCDSISKLPKLVGIKADSTACIANIVCHEKVADTLNTVLVASSGLKSCPNLKNLPNLRYVNFAHNSGLDISILGSCPSLQIVTLTSTKSTGYEILEELPLLKTAFLANNEIEDISFVENLSSLKDIYLSDNKISDITPILRNPSIEHAGILNNPIVDCPENTHLESVNQGCRYINKENRR